ncbi:MAG: aspartate ammonia-lyase [Spirochaetes bacterium]|nr:aspartate ammonia-lyase [Spirochaetota bacterium]MBN2769414.1 aspartate ammonia-lyase [Spirochaetota bacterium]
MEKNYRTESDSLGSVEISADSLFGINTMRALKNFPFKSRPAPESLIRAYGTVKYAALLMCRDLDVWDNYKAESLINAAREMSQGELSSWIVTDMMQGGAGTSLNMNVNEVIANRALILMGKCAGDYSAVSPTDDVNRFQSTNDTFPTALRLALINCLRSLESSVSGLQQSFENKEKEFARIVKLGRTELREAVLTTLGREMGTYAEAFGRDRWRLYKCEERLRVVNLGGTAIGTGLGAPREYIFGVVTKLRDLTGIGFARAENLQEATSNTDVFAEVSGILKACAVNLLKTAGDLRLLSGPLGEINLVPVQAGSSIMPGKYNPVIAESVSQAAYQVMSNDSTVTHLCAAGNLELNAFMPLLAHNMLDSAELLTESCKMLALCVEGISANEQVCQGQVENSTAVVTALVSALGYDTCSKIAQKSAESGKSIRDVSVGEGYLSGGEFDRLVSFEAVCRLGSKIENI